MYQIYILDNTQFAVDTTLFPKLPYMIHKLIF